MFRRKNEPSFNLHEAMKQQNIIHAGRLYRHKDPNRWKQAWLVLDEDCTILWFNDKHCTALKGHGNLREMINDIEVAEGALTRYSGFTPTPPFDHDPFFIAIPLRKKGKSKHRLAWFCARNSRELGEWIEAFARALGVEERFKFYRSKFTERNTPRTESTTSGGGEDRPVRVGDPLIQRRQSMRFGWDNVWNEVRKAASGATLTDDLSNAHHRVDNILAAERRAAISALPNGHIAGEEMAGSSGPPSEQVPSTTETTSSEMGGEASSLDDASEMESMQSFEVTKKIMLTSADVIEFECRKSEDASYVVERKDVSANASTSSGESQLI